MKRFAKGTPVPVERTRAEIEKLVKAHGASAFGTMATAERASVLFELKARRIRFELPLPSERHWRSEEKRRAEERRRWRCLLLNIKAKLEAVEDNIATFDEEFLAHIVVPGTTGTVGERMTPQIAAAYERGVHMPPLLSGASS
jgi:hypothetical protein